MKRVISTLLILAVGVVLGFYSGGKPAITTKPDDLTKEITIQKTEEAAAHFSPDTLDNPKKNSLFVFVGKKIELNRLPQKELSFDAAFLAKYKILEQVYGGYSKDIIEFEVYDHHGEPSFSKYQYVLLFVSVYKGRLVHEKYQYFDLYKTKDGRWASPYAKGDYKHEYNKRAPVKPEKMEFDSTVYYDVSKWDAKMIRQEYPAPYFLVDKGKAKAIYGNYIPELFKLKRNGVLKARELF